MAFPDSVPNMNTIRMLRAFRGWSQRELADASGMSPWRLWRLEKGVCDPQRDEIFKLWNALSTGE